MIALKWQPQIHRNLPQTHRSKLPHPNLIKKKKTQLVQTPFLFDLRTKPITKLQSVNESHHQTPICAITETHHQTSISATKTHHQTSIQPLNNHATHHRSTQTLICAITKTPPLTPITTNPPLPPRRSTNSDLHHADPYKPTPSTSPRQVGNTICTETHKKNANERDPLIWERSLRHMGLGLGLSKIKR